LTRKPDLAFKLPKIKNMLAESKQAQKQLYETDYHLWVLATVEHLQNREFETIDWENLIDEILDLSRRGKKKIGKFANV